MAPKKIINSKKRTGMKKKLASKKLVNRKKSGRKSKVNRKKTMKKRKMTKKDMKGAALSDAALNVGRKSLGLLKTAGEGAKTGINVFVKSPYTIYRKFHTRHLVSNELNQRNDQMVFLNKFKANIEKIKNNPEYNQHIKNFKEARKIIAAILYLHELLNEKDNIEKNQAVKEKHFTELRAKLFRLFLPKSFPALYKDIDIENVVITDQDVILPDEPELDSNLNLDGKIKAKCICVTPENFEQLVGAAGKIENPENEYVNNAAAIQEAEGLPPQSNDGGYLTLEPSKGIDGGYATIGETGGELTKDEEESGYIDVQSVGEGGEEGEGPVYETIEGGKEKGGGAGAEGEARKPLSSVVNAMYGVGLGANPVLQNNARNQLNGSSNESTAAAKEEGTSAAAANNTTPAGANNKKKTKKSRLKKVTKALGAAAGATGRFFGAIGT